MKRWLGFGDTHLIFKVTVGLILPNLSQKVLVCCLMNHWLECYQFACLNYWGRINSLLDFGDLGLIFKVTVRFKAQIIMLQLTLDRNTLLIEYTALLKQ